METLTHTKTHTITVKGASAPYQQPPYRKCARNMNFGIHTYDCIYIYTHTNTHTITLKGALPSSSTIPTASLHKMRAEFEFWYTYI